MGYDDLPDKVDVIVLGTGVTESILAAACARVGKSVLHMDRHQTYGSMFASCNFNDLQKLLRYDVISDDPPGSSENSSTPSEGLIEAHYNKILPDVLISHNDPGTKGNDDEWSIEKLEKQSRRFNLDISPRLMFARGRMVDLFISANICKYTDFKLTTRILTFSKDGELEQVPCSRSDVFSARGVTMLEKRALMKLMTLILDSNVEETFEPWLDRPFSEFLREPEFHLTSNLRNYIVNSISMCSPQDTTSCGLGSAKKFLQSLGRYGNSPFLTPIYGNGEIAQSFCRLCAVYGGIYHLNRKVEGFLHKDNVVQGIRSGKDFSSAFVVTNAECTPGPVEFKKFVSRAIVIARKSMLPADKEQITLLRIPAEAGTKPITVLELGAEMRVCPESLTIAHLSCERFGASAASDLSPTVQRLYDSETLLWVAYFSLPDTTGDGGPSAHGLKNCYMVSTPGNFLDYDFHVEEAKRIFAEMYPQEEFLPRAPDPEEIILDCEEPQTVTLNDDTGLGDVDAVTEATGTEDVEATMVTKAEEDLVKESDE